ncbi:sigma-70 family RNA polymerase sigma factor [Dactylosporangium vinaceum]|uniref:RNA polymerase sigma factor n=1 Tax=Dactylosporangium vinaceum TaxID=53362 RepID=A0ABV5MF32_9ACTN|nr:sigma-70 family RNA polymerase sigma factor [Dactylosporangium vinaceum]UAB97032.1 sigma-70 family RNA polymerase sigma factor [Dactylosporangium vinaceum]
MLDEDADDATLVAAMRDGRPEAWAAVYRRYAARLLTYARTLLRDDQTAADVLHDAFLAAAEHIAQLRAPDQLRPWLYAIVRNECRRQSKLRTRDVPLESIEEPAAADDDPATPVNAAQIRALVHAAADTLSPGDREVVYLAIQHDLSAPMVGEVLGLNPKNAHARLSRARSQLERALGALLVARGGSTGCPELATLIEGWEGRLTPTMRKRVARHVDTCAKCTEQRREHCNPAALLAGYAPVFLPVDETPPPTFVSHATTDTGDDDSPTASGTVYRAGDFGPSAAETAGRRRRKALALSAAALALLLMVGVAIWALTPAGPRSHDTADSAPHPPAVPLDTALATPPTAATTPTSAAPPSPTQPPASTPATRPSPPPSAAPPAAPPATPGPAAPATSQAPPPGAAVLAEPFTLAPFATTRCDGAAWTLLVSATADTELSSATVTWTDPAGSSHSQPLVVSGSLAAAEVRGLQISQAMWQIRATAADGRTAATPTNTATRPC